MTSLTFWTCEVAAMTKKDFYALPIEPAPEMDLPEYTEIDHIGWDGKAHPYKYTNRKYSARIVEGMLEITGYQANGTAIWRTWQDDDRVFGQTLGQSPKPSECTVASRQQWGEIWNNNSEAEEIIQKWVEKHHWPIPLNMTGLKLAGWSQTKIRHKKRDEKWDRIRQEIDNEMLEIKDPPKDFERWITRKVFRANHYLVYQYRKGEEKTSAICTRCGHEVTVKNPRNRQPGRCPRCHANATYISEKSLAQTNGYGHSGTAAYLQPTREGFCLRVFDVQIDIRSDNYRGVKASWRETDRRFYDFALDKYTKHFAWGEFETSGEIRWCKTWGDLYGGATIYPRNLKKLFAGTAWKYVPMAELARHCGNLSLINLIDNTKKNMGIEHLVKHGFWRLAKDYVKENAKKIKNARNIREAMNGLPMDEIRMLRQVDPDKDGFELYCRIRAIQRVTPEILTQMIGMGFDEEQNLLENILGNTTWNRAARYIEEQQGKYPKVNRYDWDKRKYRDMPAPPAEVARDWADYMADAVTLGWDLRSDFVLFPGNLRKAHRQTIQKVKDRENQELYEKMVSILEAQKMFCWEAGDYLIRAPKTGGEITAEGHALHHCVGGYVKSVAEGRSIILFVREKENPDSPMVTVELNPKTWDRRQARGAYNANPPAEVEKFLKKYERHLKQIRQEQERKAG